MSIGSASFSPRMQGLALGVPERDVRNGGRADARFRALGSEIGSETPEIPSSTHDSHNTAGIGTGVDERA